MKTGHAEGKFLRNQQYYNSQRGGLGHAVSYECSCGSGTGMSVKNVSKEL